MSFFSRIGDITSSAMSTVGSFFSSPKFDTVRTIAEGASDVIGAMRTAVDRDWETNDIY